MLINDIHDLVVYFSDSNSQKNQDYIYKNINKKFNDDNLDKSIKLLIKRLLVIDVDKRLSSNELIDFNKNIELHINKLIVTNLNSQEWELLNISEGEFSSSWEKVNKASSLIMKASVDNQFMKWLLTKKD
jgi:serine/threonine protein kinase